MIKQCGIIWQTLQLRWHQLYWLTDPSDLVSKAKREVLGSSD